MTLSRKIKICFVVASRANYGRIRSLLIELQNYKNFFECQIIVNGSAVLEKFGNVSKLLISDKLKISDHLQHMIEGENHVSMSKSTGLAICDLTNSFSRLKPDYVFTVADRFETMATAIAASYLNIRLIHLQGGEVTGSIDESVRHAITKLSHIHFPATKKSKERIIKMGEDKKYVFNVGCPSLDTIKKLDLSLHKLDHLKGIGYNVNIYEKFLLVVYHPVTTNTKNLDKNIQILINSIGLLDLPTIWLWPNIDAGSDLVSKSLRKAREKGILSKVHFVKNYPTEDYLKILNGTSCAIGNSSSFIREGSFLGTPAVILGDRQRNRETSKNIIKVDYNTKTIVSSVKKQFLKSKFQRDFLYGDGNTSKKIIEILINIKMPSIQKELKY